MYLMKKKHKCLGILDSSIIVGNPRSISLELTFDRISDDEKKVYVQSSEPVNYFPYDTSFSEEIQL